MIEPIKARASLLHPITPYDLYASSLLRGLALPRLCRFGPFSSANSPYLLEPSVYLFYRTGGARTDWI